MRNQTLAVLGAAVLTAAVIVVVALVAFNTGTNHPAGQPAAPPAMNTSTSTGTKAPAPTVTVTKHQAAPRSHVAAPPPQPRYGGDDQAFLELLAADGIKAPDNWAIKAGQKTCGETYDEAAPYLTEGGLYDYHVQTFLDDWSATHPGC